MKMNRIIVVLAMLLAGLNTYSQDTTQVSSNTKLLVYYFHITHRCNTCTRIETAVKKTLQDFYQAETEQGMIVFRSINVDLEEHAALCDKYSAYGADLALTKLRDGSEEIVDLTNFAFAKIHDEKVFTAGLREKIDEMLK